MDEIVRISLMQKSDRNYINRSTFLLKFYREKYEVDKTPCSSDMATIVISYACVRNRTFYFFHIIKRQDFKEIHFKQANNKRLDIEANVRVFAKKNL